MKTYHEAHYTFNNIESTYNYSSTLSYNEKITFVTSVANTVVIGDDYIPLLRDIMFDYMLVTMFTDVNTNAFTENGNFDMDAFDAFNTVTGISTDVKQSIDRDLLEELNQSIDDNIAYKTGIQKNSFYTILADVIKEIKHQIQGIDMNIVMEFMNKFADTDVSPEGVANAYFHSDAFKKNE